MQKINKHLTVLNKPEEVEILAQADGMVFMGAGGDTEEWRKGINNLLKEEGIIKDAGWEHIYKFVTHGEIINLLFSFDDVKNINMEKLAMWRLQHRSQFDVMWLSDWLENYGLTEEEE